MTFEYRLAFGKVGESMIANWLKWRYKLSVLPVYEKEISDGKGPQLFTLLADGRANNLIAPDLFVFGREVENTCWIEAKHKTAFSWHHITWRWVTGIDLRHYRDYLEVQRLSPWPVWLLFLHNRGRAKNTPPGKISPAGLYGGSIPYLEQNENHRSDKWGPSGMVYWAENTLKKLAEWDEIVACNVCLEILRKRNI